VATGEGAHHSHQPQLDIAEVEDIVGTNLAEDTALEADGDSEEDIDHERQAYFAQPLAMVTSPSP